MNVEMNKNKVLQLELNHLKETNDQLLSTIEKLKYQSYGGRRSYNGLSQSIAPKSRSTVMSKNSLLVDVVGSVVDRVASPKIPRKTARPELVHGESEISDHTKDLQKNLIIQVHEDVINKPNMLVNDKTESFNSCGKSRDLYSGITELMKEKDLLDEFDENIMRQIEPDEAENPFSVSNIYGMKSRRKHQSVTNLKNNYEDLINAREDDLQKDNSFPDEGDMTSSTSSVSDADY
ncbi:PREDICTED: uncharacterized protein LOC107161922 [Diuraphis noxia]|uniref:uncharacterized protein LOC107161922 n=1 Tax=Diuraphis noxia TaxID=143948 RepID=UPI00076375A3|nr:PREDICTED: uncharacterized protein LOC107161922 [Diuraphis noxia]